MRITRERRYFEVEYCVQAEGALEEYKCTDCAVSPKDLSPQHGTFSINVRRSQITIHWWGTDRSRDEVVAVVIDGFVSYRQRRAN
jgi:hypothetical protein